ncbi:MAG: gamma-glutamyltransferase [Acidobacteriota bacterium]|nr:gamma-glutamyltransferase [Acidobacteriota bacterium]
MGRTGVIATSQPLASAAGLGVFRHGGNAIDAAVTAAAVLAVVEPTMTGIGGDLFAIVHDARTGHTRGLNASGRAPAAAGLDELRRLGHAAMPHRGPLSVTVPGAVDGWSILLNAHGTYSLAQALAPAIRYARDGYPVAEVVARQWQDETATLAADPTTAAALLPGGHAPAAGERFSCPALATSLETLASDGRDALYDGPLGHAIARDITERGGWLTASDFRTHLSEWVEPIRGLYGEVELLELPPNTQGFVALEALNIVRHDNLSQLGHNTPAYLHLMLEALAMAFVDRNTHLADPAAFPKTTLQRLLSEDYAQDRRRAIRSDRVSHHPALGADHRHSTGDTVYLAAADEQGNLVSLIQSLYEGFGAGIVAGDTGIVLHNRGSLFVTDPEHPNHLAPRKRPLHTLAPALAFYQGRPWLAFGVMGGDMQPQGHLQVLLNMTAFGMNLQQAGEAPRARYDPTGIALEAGIAPATVDALTKRGHRVVQGLGFGGFQGVLIDPDTGTLMGGSDPRKDGVAIGI